MFNKCVLNKWTNKLFYQDNFILFWNQWLQINDLKCSLWNIRFAPSHPVHLSLAFTVTLTILEASVAQGNSSSLQGQAYIWPIPLPHSLILLHQAFETLSNFQAAVIEQILLLLKLCQLPHYCSHNSGKAQTRTTSWEKPYHSLF